MLANFSVNSELGNLIQIFLQKHKIQSNRLNLLLAKEYIDGRMPITDWWQALDYLQQETQLPHIGIELGSIAEPAHGGALGYMVQAASDASQALVDFQKYQRIIYEGANSEVELSEEEVKLVWPLDYGYSTRESDDTLIAGLLSFIRHSTADTNLNPKSVGFVHPAPKNKKPYLDFFKCDVIFNAPCMFISFPVSYFNKPIANPDSVLHRILEEQVEHQLENLSEAESFLRWFYQHLLLSMQRGEPTVEVIAKRMLISPRTLFRKLENNGIHFKDILLETRQKLAKQHLAEEQLSLVEISNLLGYSEQSAFSRAFKKWTGQTPKRFQKSQQNIDISAHHLND